MIMRLQYILLIIILGRCASSQEIQHVGEKELLQRVVESHPVLSYSMEEIPKRIKLKYKEKFNTVLDLSNPGSSYNKTDVIYKGEPFGMLLFSGMGINNVGFFLFETKGITSQCHLVYYGLNGKNVTQMESVVLKRQPQGFEDLKQVLIDKEYF